MDHVRLATPAEVEGLREGSDLSGPCTVFAFGQPSQEKQPDFAVFRMAPELDPVYFAPQSDNRRKAMFIWALENGLRMMGTVPHYYFNIAASDTTWQHVAETSGAKRVSAGPEYRYSKVLMEPLDEHDQNHD